MIPQEIHDLRVARDYAAIEEAVKAALPGDPANASLWNVLAESMISRGRFQEALKASMQAISYDPLSYQAWTFLGNAHAGLGDWPSCQMAAQRSMDICPDLPQAHWLLGHSAMAMNQWGEAWNRLEYGCLGELRKIRMLARKAWQGQDVKGKTLFVWSEQGVGDAIQHLRFLPMLKEKTGANILLECKAALCELARPLADMVIAEQPDRSMSYGFDYHVPLMDLGLYLGLDTKDISGKPYLSAPYALDTKGKIGLTWKGSSVHGNDHNRSMPTELLEEFKGIKNLVAIQPDQEAPKWLKSLELSDFSSTAAALKDLDCLITVDTATAHLAGALGLRTIMIAPMGNTEARWAYGDKTVWYDSWTIVHAPSFKEAIMRAKELLNG